MNSIYDTLMELPLLKGSSRYKLSEIVGTTKFHFLKYLAGETIVSAGTPCTHVIFILSGKVRISISNANDRFRVSSTLEAPNVISPEFLFGRATHFPGTITAIDSVSVLQISKTDYIKILNSDETFLFNALNMLSLKAQNAVDGILAITSGKLAERIAYWVMSLTQQGSTDIVLTARQRDLYALFGVQRSSFFATLDEMKEQGLIEYDSTEIRFSSRQGLLDILDAEG